MKTASVRRFIAPYFFPFGALRAWFKSPGVSGGDSARLAVAFNAAPCASSECYRRGESDETKPPV